MCFFVRPVSDDSSHMTDRLKMTPKERFHEAVSQRIAQVQKYHRVFFLYLLNICWKIFQYYENYIMRDAETTMRFSMSLFSTFSSNKASNWKVSL